MSSDVPRFVTSRIEASDAKSGFQCGKHALDDYFKRYAIPNDVANIGRLAIDERAQRRGLGEKLLMDAFRRVMDGAGTLDCVGVIVDAKDEGAERFYLAYGFVTILAEQRPRRMFLALGTVRDALEG